MAPKLTPKQGLALEVLGADGYTYNRVDDDQIVAQHDDTWEEGAWYANIEGDATDWEWVEA